MSHFATESQRARLAQQLWAARPLQDRLPFVTEFRFKLVERVKDLTAAVEADVARPPDEVTGTDVLSVAAAAKYLSANASRVLKPKRVGSTPLWLWGCKDVIHHRPWGNVGLIGTWNYPIFLNAIPILHALVAGNAVLWKPSELAPRSGDVLHRLFLDCGIPADLLIKLPATREAGPQLAEADIDFLHFTGSDVVGRKLAARLGERLIPSALELSGVDAAIVLDDADLDLAVQGVWFGTTLNRGQTCMSTRRAFVAKPLYDSFIEKLMPFVTATPAMAMQTPGQVTQATRLVSAVTVGSSVTPTVMKTATPESPVCQEASFSPILAVMPLEDAAKDHNASPFGLSCAIYTKNPEAAMKLVAELKVGSVVINDVIVPTAHPATSFGGRGASGWGVTQGDDGLLQMTVAQVVTVRGGRFRPHVAAALTNDPAVGDVTIGLLKMSHSRRLRDRIAGMFQMMKGVRKSKKLP
ncbi:aldehyde dehydrogenase family protein [soil metagenome]